MLILFGTKSNASTWNKAKWRRWSSNWGRLNQKYLSEPCTRGIPWTTACLSVIPRAILVRIAWSFVLTAKMIWKVVKMRLTGPWHSRRFTQEYTCLTSTGRIDAQNNVSQPNRNGRIFQYTNNKWLGKAIECRAGSPLTFRSRKITNDAHRRGLQRKTLSAMSTNTSMH